MKVIHFRSGKANQADSINQIKNDFVNEYKAIYKLNVELLYTDCVPFSISQKRDTNKTQNN